jgi:hypothetical protein
VTRPRLPETSGIMSAISSRGAVGPPPLVRFVNLIFHAFGPQIEQLQEQKIEMLSRCRVAHPDRDIFEDRSLEILSRVAIDVRASAALAASTRGRLVNRRKPA